jgi:hypothetical protein
MPNGFIKRLSAIFAFGVIFVVVILVLAFFVPNPSPMLYLVMRVILSLATASVATLLTGFINIQIPNFLKAGGAFAVFVIVFFYNPAALVSPPQGSITGSITLGSSPR